MHDASIENDSARTRARVREFLLKNAFRSGETASIPADDQSLIFSGRINSLAVVDLISFIESEFPVNVAHEEIEIKDFDTIDNICRLIETNRVP
jgi:acyl carrier protein